MCGAGTSHGLVPLPHEIVRDNRARAEAEIGAVTGKAFPPLPNPGAWDALYVWAQIAEEELKGANDPCPKLKLAQALGLTTDVRWLAGVGLPATQSKARHRVIARFAREDKWQSIWTFNWDCHIEAALESVGFREEETLSNQPWPVRYQRIIRLADYGKLPDKRTKLVHKRHGCIRNLKQLEKLQAEGKAQADDYNHLRFRITKKELEEVVDKNSGDYKSFRGQIDSEFSGRPLVVCGWSAGEKYLLDAFDASKNELRKYPQQLGRLSVIDQQFNGTGHAALAAIYDVAQAQAYFSVSANASEPDQDEFFLWLQSVFALNEIYKTLDNTDPIRPWLLNLINASLATVSPNQSTRWVDSFLPAWVQLCWRAGLVRARYQNEELRPEEIKLEGDEWYVPLSQNLPDRPELVAAAPLLRAVLASTSAWRFDVVPGGLYCEARAQLVLPIPGWTDTAQVNMLNSMTRLLNRVAPKRGLVNELALLPVSLDGSPVTEARRARIKDAYLHIARLPADTLVKIVDLAAI
jgi:hypothetical protein